MMKDCVAIEHVQRLEPSASILNATLLHLTGDNSLNESTLFGTYRALDHSPRPQWLAGALAD